MERRGTYSQIVYLGGSNHEDLELERQKGEPLEREDHLRQQHHRRQLARAGQSWDPDATDQYCVSDPG